MAEPEAAGSSASGKGEDPKAAIRFDDVAEVNRLGVGETDDRRGMKALAEQRSLQPDAGRSRSPVKIDGP